MDPEVTDYGIADKDSRTTIINIKNMLKDLKENMNVMRGELEILK